MHGFTSTMAAIWRLTIPYFRSEDRWPGRILIASVIAIAGLSVGLASVGIGIGLGQQWTAYRANPGVRLETFQLWPG